MKTLITLLFISISCFANTIGESNNQFAFSLFSEIEKNTNAAISPIGIFTNLSLLYAGADNNTAEELRKTLRFDDSKAFFDHLKQHIQESELEIANALFPHTEMTILPSYLDLAEKIFQAKVQNFDYNEAEIARNFINGWIAEKTHDKITDLISEEDIDDATHLILANSVYFKGNWIYPFPKQDKALFYPENDPGYETDMLYLRKTLSYFENEQVQCLTLPFKQNQFECILLLPKEGSIQTFEKSLSLDSIQTWLNQSELHFMEVHAPKFSFSYRTNLSAVLQSLGIKEAFSMGADLSKITGQKDLSLDRVLHETYFSFDQHGVTAAAATTSHLCVTSAPSANPTPFHANHPFIFLINNSSSNTILFMGRCMHPGESDEN